MIDINELNSSRVVTFHLIRHGQRKYLVLYRVLPLSTIIIPFLLNDLQSTVLLPKIAIIIESSSTSNCTAFSFLSLPAGMYVIGFAK